MMALRFGFLLLVLGIFMWSYVVFRLRTASAQRFEFKVSAIMSRMEGLLCCILLFALYFGILITLNDWQSFEWLEWQSKADRNIYFMLLPEILTFIVLNVFFFIETKNLSKLNKL